MKLTWRQYQAVVARSLYIFFLDGTLKAYGVIMEETVNSSHTYHYLIGFAFSLQTGLGYLIAPLAGVFDQRVHPRIVALIGGFLAGLGFIGRAFILSSEPWLLVLCLSISGVGFGLINVITVISLKETFESRYYTIAFSVTVLPSYIGIAVMPPLLEYLQREYGIHIGMAVCGVLSWTLMLSGLFTPSGKTDSKDGVEMTDLELLEKDQKRYNSTERIQKRCRDTDYKGPLNDTTGPGDCNKQSKGFYHAASNTDRDSEGNMQRIKIRKTKMNGDSDETIVALKCLKAWIFIAKNHPEFLFLTFLTMLLDHGFTSWSIFLVPYGEFLGLDSSTAVWLSTLGGSAGLVGRLFSIVLFSVNRMNLSVGLLMPVLCVTSAYVISLFYSSFLALAVVSCFSGFGLAVQGCTLPSWLPDCVCEYNFKTAVYGFYAVCGIMTLAGGITTGGIVDISGSYRVSFASLAVLSSIQATVVLIWLICPYIPSPEKSASSRKDRTSNCCSGV